MHLRRCWTGIALSAAPRARQQQRRDQLLASCQHPVHLQLEWMGQEVRGYMHDDCRISQSHGDLYNAELQTLTVKTEGRDPTWAAAAVACCLRSAVLAWPS